MFGEELFGLRLECLPWRVCDYCVKAAASVDDLVKLVAPVKWLKRFDVFDCQRTLLWFALLLLWFIPCCFLKLDPEPLKLGKKNLIECLDSFLFLHFDIIAQGAQVIGITSGVAVEIDQAVLLSQQFAIALAEQIALSLTCIKLLVIDVH